VSRAFNWAWNAGAETPDRPFRDELLSIERLEERVRGRQSAHVRIRHDEDAPGAEIGQVHADFASRACAEPQVGGGQLKGSVELGHGKLTLVNAI
jgi:hypothetical protein